MFLIIGLFLGAGLPSFTDVNSLSAQTMNNNNIILNQQPTQMDIYPPNARFNWTPAYATDGNNVYFDASASYEPFGFIVSYHWTYTQGSSPPVDMGNGKQLTYIWIQPGTYQITLNVTDDDGQWDVETKTITIHDNEIPKADFTWQQNGLTVTFIDNSIDDGEITYYAWDFTNDGREDDFGEMVTYTFPADGTYPVRLVIQDEEGLYNKTTKNVTVFKLQPDLNCVGNLNWNRAKSGAVVTGSFTVSNSGDSGSTLDWEVISYPSWGANWEFSPKNGFDLTPEDGLITVTVNVTVPNVKETTFEDKIQVLNLENTSDLENVTVSLTTPKHKYLNIFLSNFLENHQFLLSLLKQYMPIP